MTEIHHILLVLVVTALGFGVGSPAQADETLLIRQEINESVVCEDTTIYRDAPDENLNQGEYQPYLALRKAGEGKQGLVRVALIRWTLPADQLADREVVGATMTLYVQNAQQDGQRIGLFPVKRPWDVNEVSWKSASASNDWRESGSQGGDDVEVSPAAEAETRPEDGHLVEFVLPVELVKQWVVDPDSNHGLLIQFTDDRSDLSAEFYASESRGSKHEMRPSLALTVK